MDINSLVIFYKVADTSSFTKTSKILEIPIPTVSRKINKLEEDLKIKLFNRTTRSISLTQDGINLYEKSKPLFESLENIQSEFNTDDNLLSGEIRLTSTFEERYYLSQLVYSFRLKYPNINIFVHFSNSFENLIEKSFDFAFRGGNLEDSNLFYYKIREENLAAYINKKFFPNRVNLESLNEFDYLVMESNTFLETKDNDIFKPKNKIVSNSIEFIKEIAKLKPSILYIPERYSDDDFIKINIFKEKKTSFQVVYLNKNQNKICKLFLEFIKNYNF